jgi:transposase
LVFGASSEKKQPAKPPADGGKGGAGGTGGKSGAGGAGSGRPRGQQPGSAGHRRRDYSHLETVEEVHDVPAGERFCPHCGAEYAPFGEERAAQIDWQVRLVRIIHRRPTYRRACRCQAPGVLVAPVPPKPIPKGLFTAGFLARLLTEKYVLGRPLERIVAALASEGFEVAPGTLVGALQALSALLAPLDAAIRARNAAAAHLHIDETSWNVFEAIAEKANRRWWLWAFIGADTSVFSIEPSRSTRVLAEHLHVDLEAGSLEAGRHLLASSDFFTAYQALGRVDGVDPLWCWAHIRRYFIRAGDAHAELAAWTRAWLQRIGALYVAHRTLAASEGSAASEEGDGGERLAEGAAERERLEAGFAAALEAIDAARHLQAADDGLHPAARKVLATLGREWEGLARHRQFPELPLDNNTAERALRAAVVGRKNYYGSGSVWAAEAAGRIWTVTATAARAGCNPLSYLIAYLEACAREGGRPPAGEALARFFPWALGPADAAAWREAPP